VTDHRDEPETPQVIVRDRRRIDPQTGKVRMPDSHDDETIKPDATADVPLDVASDETADQAAELKAQLDERTADLQRLTAEYANYRKRIERDREVVISSAKAQVAVQLLSVLDDIDRASTHGDLTGAFKAVADKLVAALSGMGLEPFAHEGEEFDPSIHEAVQHDTSAEVTGPTVTAVLRRGYRFGDRVIRPALVAVTDYEAPQAEQPTVSEPDQQAQ
jgi:molecular chaperone GrpE